MVHFNGQDSDVRFDATCENEDFVGEVDGIAWTRSYGDDVDWICPVCRTPQTEERHYL